METTVGVLVVAAAGLFMGSGAWPMKLMRTFQFEHWWMLAMLTGLIVMPWTITLAAFPHVFQVYRDVPASTLITSNLFAACWGLANVLCGLCFVRIGIALTGAILTGLGASVAVVVPLVFKGSGLFKDAPAVTSPAGLCVLAGVAVMLLAVALASLAGFGRDRELKKLQKTSGSFLGGLIMVVVAGVTSAGILLAFVYAQGPIVARVSILEAGQEVKLAVSGNQELTGSCAIGPDGTIALRGVGEVEVAGLSAQAAADKVAGLLKLSQETKKGVQVQIETANLWAIFPVWAIGLLGGALVNILYPVYLLTKNKSWAVLTTNWKEVGLSIVMGVQFCVAIVLCGKGMVLLGVLGASVGAGIQQAMQMIGGQGVGFISGEWRGVYGAPRRQMYLAIAMLLVATVILAYSNTLAN